MQQNDLVQIKTDYPVLLVGKYQKQINDVQSTVQCNFFGHVFEATVDNNKLLPYTKSEASAMSKKLFVCFFHFIGWHNINFGISFDVASPNIEMHLPFGFVRIGWETTTEQSHRFGFSSYKAVKL